MAAGRLWWRHESGRWLSVCQAGGWLLNVLPSGKRRERWADERTSGRGWFRVPDEGRRRRRNGRGRGKERAAGFNWLPM